MRGRDQRLPRAARERAGYQVIYLSGGGVAAALLGLPTWHQQSEDVPDRRAPHHGRLLTALAGRRRYRFRRERLHIRAARQVADQGGRGGDAHRRPGRRKRCGHRPGKELVPKEEMVDRIKAAVDAKTDPDFVVNGAHRRAGGRRLERAIERALACVEAGADAVFPEAMTESPMYRKFVEAVKVPVLPTSPSSARRRFSRSRSCVGRGRDRSLSSLGVRAMNAAGAQGLQCDPQGRNAESVLDLMQTRAELYETPRLSRLRAQARPLFAKEKSK